MNLGRKAATAGVTASGPGEFDLLLSNGTRDRDGEELLPGDWSQPLPKSIPINVNHSANVSDIVGSGTPFIDGDGNLRVKGTYADTPEGQHIRSLVTGGHLRSVSVEFLRRKNPATGVVEHELVGGAFVNVPANPEARVLASKSAAPKMTFDEFKAYMTANVLKKAAETPVAEGALLQAIHDASCHLGAQCVQPAEDMDPIGDDDGANKAAALRLRMKMLGKR